MKYTHERIVNAIVEYGMSSPLDIIIRNDDKVKDASLVIGDVVLKSDVVSSRRDAYYDIVEHYHLWMFVNDITTRSEELQADVRKITSLFEENFLDTVLHFDFSPTFDDNGRLKGICLYLSSHEPDDPAWIWVDTVENRLYVFELVRLRLTSVPVDLKVCKTVNAFVDSTFAMTIPANNGNKYGSVSQAIRNVMALEDTFGDAA